MGLFDWLAAPARVPTKVPAPDQVRELVLYKYDMCGYCHRVTRAAQRLGVVLVLRDTMTTSGVRAELREKTGRTQVPCLFIDGEPLFESADIVAWLEAYAQAAPAR